MTTSNVAEVNLLVSKTKKGDSTAFEEIYSLFAQRIFRFIHLKIQNQQEAEDVLQEVFIKAHKGIANLSLVDLNFTAWLYKITSNTINDHFRKKYRTPEITELTSGLNIADKTSVYKEIEIKSDFEMARSVFALLPWLYRQVLELRFVQNFSSQEVASILNKNNLAVRILQHRALKKVRTILNQNELPNLFTEFKSA